MATRKQRLKAAAAETGQLGVTPKQAKKAGKTKKQSRGK